MNLLGTKRGRMAAFGGLYLSEGIPGGFVTVAVATELQRRGMDEAAFGAFFALLVLPWSWKFVMGPLVDNLHFRRFGARKQWIVGAQIGMLVALVAAMFHLPEKIDGETAGLGLFIFLLVLHNTCAATQDVAIDALACQVLKKEERGTANGIMFGSAQAGQAIGGSVVLWLKGTFGSFEMASLVVPVLMFAIIVGVITLICEKSAGQEMADGELAAPEPGDHGWRAVKDQIIDYTRTAGRTFFMTKRGLLAFLMAALPIGGLALSMVLSTIIGPRLGMTDNELASLNLACSAVWVPCCLFGGWLSDRFSRRIMLGAFASMSVVPGLWIGWQFHQAGFDHPPAQIGDSWPREEELIHLWWLATMAFSVFNGLKYGIKNALFMDIVNPKIAATQFTALMAMSNLTNSYTAFWQGQAIALDKWGWTIWKVLVVDSAVGLLFLLVLVFLKPKPAGREP